MGVKVANYVRTTIADTSGINAAALSFQPASTAGWPALATAADYFYLTLVSVTTNAKEIVKVTSYTSTTAQITRAQDGTEALAFANGDRAELWVCRAVFTDLQAEQASAIANVALVTANYTALSIPGTALADNFLLNRHISDGRINGIKLNPAVAGAGMIQDASGNLQVVGGTYIQANADNLDIKEGSLVKSLSSYKYNASASGRFCAFAAYGSVAGGTNVFYTGTRPWTVYGTAGEGCKLVCAVFRNDHATIDATIKVTIGSDLSYYTSTGTDTGTDALVITINDTTFFGNTPSYTATFMVPPGHRYMFQSTTGGTPNCTSHTWIELQ